MINSWEFYKDTISQWWWRRTDSNGNIAAVSSQGYANIPACVGNARSNGWNGVYAKDIIVRGAK
jgi:uncharacterized protein YegP (UPF0339 family)